MLFTYSWICCPPLECDQLIRSYTIFFKKKKTVFSSSSSGQLSIAPRLRGRLHTIPPFYARTFSGLSSHGFCSCGHKWWEFICTSCQLWPEDAVHLEYLMPVALKIFLPLISNDSQVLGGESRYRYPIYGWEFPSL